MRGTSTYKGVKRSFTAVAGSLAGLLLLAACSDSDSDKPDVEVAVDDETCKRNEDAGTITYISGYGYSASAGQMDVFIADELGYFDELCLDVDINAAGADGQQLVSSGQAQFTALGTASDVLLAATNSENLTAVATYGDSSPISIFANEKIQDLTDLHGGSLGYFINLSPIAMATLSEAGADLDQIEEIKMTNYDPTVVTRGQVDAIVGYTSNQPETLKAMDEPFSEFVPSDYGIQGTYNIMEVNSQFLNENREVVEDFMRADLKALQYCLENGDECLEIMDDLAQKAQQGDAFPKEQNERTWKVESQWVDETHPGVQTEEMWEEEYEIVEKYGDVDQLPALSEVMDVDLVADLFDGDELIWPGDDQ